MVNLFGLSIGDAKCADCGMKLDKRKQVHEWEGRKFCCGDCKRNFRVKTNTGHGSSSCH